MTGGHGWGASVWVVLCRIVAFYDDKASARPDLYPGFMVRIPLVLPSVAANVVSARIGPVFTGPCGRASLVPRRALSQGRG